MPNEEQLVTLPKIYGYNILTSRRGLGVIAGEVKKSLDITLYYGKQRISKYQAVVQ